MGTQARILEMRREGTDWFIRFTCRDNDVFWWTVSEIKERVPSWDRHYDKEARGWWVAEWWLSTLSSLFSNYEEMRHNPGSTGSTGSRSRSRSQDSGFSSSSTSSSSSGVPEGVRKAFTILYLLPDAPTEVVKAAYKAMALLHHPDHGGDTEQMKRINLAYEQARIWSATHGRGAA